MTTAGVEAYRRTTTRPYQGARAGKARFNRLMLKIMGVVVMICLFVYISRMAIISSGSKSINALRREISTLESDRQYLEISLSARQSLDRVYDEAVNRLGMSYPGEERVKVVSLSGDTGTSSRQTVFEGASDSAMP